MGEIPDGYNHVTGDYYWEVGKHSTAQWLAAAFLTIILPPLGGFFVGLFAFNSLTTKDNLPEPGESSDEDQEAAGVVDGERGQNDDAQEPSLDECGECGATIKSTQKYCSECGAELTVA